MKTIASRWIAFAAVLAAALAPACHAQAQLAGDWQGTLSAGGVELRLVLHITTGKDGTLTATLDVVDQGAYAIPVSAISLSDSKFNMTVDTLHGDYTGTVNKDATEIDGTWSQGQSLDLNFKRAPASIAAPAPKPAPPTDIDGTWSGTLDAGATKLHLLLKFLNTQDGLTARMQSPDQSPMWVTATSVKRSGASLTVAFAGLRITFEGKIAGDLGSIDGTFTQMGNESPLVLQRVKDEPVVERPRNPVKPYREEDVTYTNKPAGATLAATLTVPPGKGPFPAVLLIAGSGPNERDHKRNPLLADYLTRHGIIVLSADKRGIGKSTGNYYAATMADFADDAQAGVDFLKTRPEVDVKKIGLVGHSEGGIVAPMVAARDKDVAFVVMMAGSGLSGDQLWAWQDRLDALARGEPADKVAKENADEKEILAMVVRGADDASIEKKIRESADQKTTDAQIGAQVKELTSPWARYFLVYDPAPALRQLKCPVLVLAGSLDQKAPPSNLPAIRKALEEGGNKHFEVDELPGLNHEFKTVKTGAPGENAQVDESMSPVALDKIATWILRQ